MRNANNILTAALAALAELENAQETEHPTWRAYYCGRLQALCDVLGDDIPAEYWERLEKFVCRP